MNEGAQTGVDRLIPWFGARTFARQLQTEIRTLQTQLATAKNQIAELGILSLAEREERRTALEKEITAQADRLEKEKLAAAADIEQQKAKAEEIDALRKARFESEKAIAEREAADARKQLEDTKKAIVVTEDVALLQEVGVYSYRHPLTDVVAYEQRLADIEEQVKSMTRKDGGAVVGTTNWTVNGSAAAGRAMVRDFSKLMLRAFNAEADNLVRSLKPFKLEASKDRLNKVSDAIVRLGKTMDIRVTDSYRNLRLYELELTADYLQKQAEQKEAERAERERLREERKAQQEIERERQRLDKERQHYTNALEALSGSGDEQAIARVKDQLAEVDRAIEGVDYRAANIRAGYVYVISNIGSFGEKMVKVGMTRRLEPMDRIRELGDASVPFNFDVHALFFSKDAVGIETAMHDRLAGARVNLINRRREFFRATPVEVKAHLGELAGELLQFDEMPEALEYRQGLAQQSKS